MKKWHWAILALLTITSIIVELTAHHDATHAHHWWSSVPAFFAAFGFIGCVAIIIVSKYIGKKLLQKDEDYYDAE